ncbi:P-loop NTPase family protein [Pseudoneobacillus sp. C159]
MRKLFIFEGIPGSGKTTTAKWLAQLLTEEGEEAYLFLEGNPEHPADYESVACVTEQQLSELEMNFPIVRTLAEQKGAWFFIPYARLADSHPDLFKALQKFDVYELSVEDFCEVTLMRWQEFVEKALHNNNAYVLECCFLQNPFTFLLAKHDQAKELIFHHLQEISNLISVLNPVIVYFEQDDIKGSLARVRQERSSEWFDFLTWYYTEQGYGRARDIKGEDGVIHFLEDRKKLEKEILTQLPIESIVLNNSEYNWNHCKEVILKQLQISTK